MEIIPQLENRSYSKTSKLHLPCYSQQGDRLPSEEYITERKGLDTNGLFNLDVNTAQQGEKDGEENSLARATW